ncbi:MAG: hypothetical protein LBB18_00940, partial [Puniceicoccales bacterium]|nr:hypothetical protein [Puniceicoccales bacterium]
SLAGMSCDRRLVEIGKTVMRGNFLELQHGVEFNIPGEEFNMQDEEFLEQDGESDTPCSEKYTVQR